MFLFLPLGITLECYIYSNVVTKACFTYFFFLFLPVVMLQIVTVSIYYDEKTNINKRGGLNKLQRDGDFFQKIRNAHSLILGTEENGFSKFHIELEELTETLSEHSYPQNLATSKTWTRTLDPDPEKPGP